MEYKYKCMDNFTVWYEDKNFLENFFSVVQSRKTTRVRSCPLFCTIIKMDLICSYIFEEEHEKCYGIILGKSW